MAYKKRPMQKRKCVHCATKFEANHIGRIYCSSSCNTLAWRARQPVSERSIPAEVAEATTLALSAQNVAVVALGTAAAQVGTHLWQQATQGGSDLDLVRAEMQQLRQELQAAQVLPPPVSVLSYLPEEVRTATSPVVPIQLGATTVSAVRVRYQGHVLYHNQSQQLLVWEERAGVYHRITREQQLAQLASKPAHQAQPATELPPLEAFPALVLDSGPQAQPEQARSSAAAERAFEAALRAGMASEEGSGSQSS